MSTACDIRVDEEFRALIPPLSADELRQLEANLIADGCRDPLVVWAGHGILLDGHNRREICGRLGIAYRVHEVQLKDRDAAKDWIIKNQFGRRNLQPFQRAELALKLEVVWAGRAAENKRAAGEQHGRGKVFPTSGKAIPPVHTDAELAKAAGVGKDTIHKSRKIAEKAPEPIKEKLRRGETTINREYKAIVKAEKRAEQVEAVKSAKLPPGKFHVIVADPPWNYESRAADPTHRAANPYPSMSLADIKHMPVIDRAHDDCILWLWTTNAFMVQAHEVAREWGFEVKTILTWAKDRIGTGDWLRGQTEHCLMAVRGKPTVNLAGQSTLLHGPLREHSRKPDEFYRLVESLCPGSKCELFSRENREGWKHFGAEVGAFD